MDALKKAVEQDRRFLDVLHDNRDGLVKVARELNSLGSAFEKTGNTIVAEKLFYLSASVDNLSQEIVTAYGKMLSANLDDSQRAVGETLRAMLIPVTAKE